MWNFILFTLLTDKVTLLHPLFLLLAFFGIQVYSFTDCAEIKNTIKQLKIKNSSIVKSDQNIGVIIGKWFIGYIFENDSSEKKSQNFYLIMRRKDYCEIKKTIDDKRFNLQSTEKEKEPCKVNIWNSTGSKWWRDYNNCIADWSHIVPQINQISIVENIKKLYNEKRTNSVVIYVYGPPGSGKTSIGLIIAKEFKSHYYDGWKPLSEGNHFSGIYSHINPDKEQPLVIVVNEIDTYIKKLDKQEPIKDVERQFDGKTDWNNFFDSVGMGLYPNVIIITTGNTPVSEFDNSLMRKGRFDIVVELENLIDINIKND
jgi:hypothetical protein